MKTSDLPFENTFMMMNNVKEYLTQQEELAFRQLLFSSSVSIKGANYGLTRKDLEKILGIGEDDEAFQSFLERINAVVSHYYRVIYDERRDRVIVMMRVVATQAKSTLGKEALAMMLYLFYHQEVLGHNFTSLHQIVEDFGHESLNAEHKLKISLADLKKIGAVIEYESAGEEAYRLTAIGVHMFSDSFLHRTMEFAQERQVSKEEVMKFFNRDNLAIEEENK